MGKINIRIWVLIIALLISCLLIINFDYFEQGVKIKSIEADSSANFAGMRTGEFILSINEIPVNSIEEFYINTNFDIKPKEFTIITDKSTYTYSDYLLNFNLALDNSIKSVEGNAKTSGLGVTEKVLSINGIVLEGKTFREIKQEVEPNIRIEITTNKQEYVFLTTKNLGITPEKPTFTRLKTGLDLQGGARALVKAEKKLTGEEFNDLKQVIDERLNAYGLTDLVLKEANDPILDEKYLIVELAGSTPKQLSSLIGQQGKFEAKIGENLVFTGGNKDITSVCRYDASCASVTECFESNNGQICKFMFQIDLSEEAAKRHAELTSKLSENITSGESYLNESLDLYLDDILVDTLLISSDLKGKEATRIVISGSGSGSTIEEAKTDAAENMKRLQTILITGSLPFKIEIVKLDTISPSLGKEFLDNVFIAGLIVFMSICLFIIIRYRKLNLAIPVVITIFSEAFITLGIAAAIGWNLDLPSIAGIIAAIGTGVDDQIVMIDESNFGKQYTLKERIKRAFFIIFGSYATTSIALIPLWWAGAGMLRGFVVTTILGISVGVLITRPAFAEILKKITKD